MKTLVSLLLLAVVVAMSSGCATPEGAPASRPDSFQEESAGVLWKWKKDR